MGSGSGDDTPNDLKGCSDFYDLNNFAAQLGCDFPRGGEHTQNLILAALLKQICLSYEGEIIQFPASAQDSFARLRVSTPYTIFDSKQIFNEQPLFWDEELESGAGITSNHDADRASTILTSTVSTAGLFTRQTFRRFNYQPGKSQLILMTGILTPDAGGTGVKRRIGYFDDDNGIFLQDNEGTIQLVVRSNVTGSPVNTSVDQANWNDPMDGTGVSGITLDFSKVQIFGIDFEWLGVGIVRTFFVVDGMLHYVHQFNHANLIDSVYMSTPNLPIRWQLETTASSPVSKIEHICSSVSSEGGQDPNGITRWISTAGTHVDAATENVIYGIIGIRLKSTNLGEDIDILKASLQIHTASHSGEWMLIFNPTVGGTPSFAGISNSSLEYVAGATANTVTNGTIIDGGYIESGGAAIGGNGSGGSGIINQLKLGAAIDGTPDEIWLCFRPIGGSSAVDVEGGIHVRELTT
jgi:hypothetical protein